MQLPMSNQTPASWPGSARASLHYLEANVMTEHPPACGQRGACEQARLQKGTLLSNIVVEDNSAHPDLRPLCQDRARILEMPQ